MDLRVGGGSSSKMLSLISRGARGTPCAHGVADGQRGARCSVKTTVKPCGLRGEHWVG